jgi:hypothetical protein
MLEASAHPRNQWLLPKRGYMIVWANAPSLWSGRGQDSVIKSLHRAHSMRWISKEKHAQQTMEENQWMNRWLFHWIRIALFDLYYYYFHSAEEETDTQRKGKKVPLTDTVLHTCGSGITKNSRWRPSFIPTCAACLLAPIRRRDKSKVAAIWLQERMTQRKGCRYRMKTVTPSFL